MNSPELEQRVHDEIERARLAWADTIAPQEDEAA